MMEKISMKRQKIAIAALLFAMGIAGCSNGKQEAQERIRSVKACQVHSMGSKSKVFTGVVKESREVKLAFQVPGSLIGLKVEEGQYVRKGQMLAVLDARDYEVQLESANANYEQAKVQAERYAALYKKKSTSKSVFDQTQAAFKLARAQKEAAENALSDTKIYAPFAGYVQTKFVENHEKVGAGQPIVSLLDLNNLEVLVSLSEADYLMSQRFENFRCGFESLGGERVFAKLIDIDKKPQDGQFYKMRLQPLTESANKLVPGMVAEVQVNLNSLSTEQVCCVPVESVIGKQGQSFVWVFDQKKSVVTRRAIQTGDLNSQGKMEVKKGITAGDWVITAGVHSLKEGQKVRLLKSVSKSNIGGQL
jgi:RND family efflux transporter MFP subunit